MQIFAALLLATQMVAPDAGSIDEPITNGESATTGIADLDDPIAPDAHAEGTVVADVSSDESLADSGLPQPAPEVLIHRDTPVLLMILNEVSTKDHEAGHRFRLRVDQPVVVDGEEVVPIGATAWGELLEATKSGNAGKSGKLSARLLHLEWDDREISLDGDAFSQGKSGKGETILGVIGLGPLGLLARGNNAKLKAGDKITGFISEDVMAREAEDNAS